KRSICIKLERKSTMKTRNIHKSPFFQLQFVIIVFLCLFDLSFVKAQDAVKQYSDSLLKNVEKTSAIEEKIEGLLQISIFWIDHDTVKAYQYLEEAHQLMDKPPTDYQKGLYHLYHANILMDFEPQKA